MKKLIPHILFLFLLSCQSENKAVNEKNAGEDSAGTNEQTEIEFLEEMYNFGSLQSGQIVIYPFEFRNTGTGNLYINSIEADCGCVSFTSSEKPVLPGASGVIEIEFNTAGLTGRQLKTIVIHANTKKPKQLVIFADVKNELLEY